MFDFRYALTITAEPLDKLGTLSMAGTCCRIVGLVATCGLLAGSLQAQQTVCDIFGNLKAADGQQLTVTGDLLIAPGLVALGATDCDDDRWLTGGPEHDHRIWPVLLDLQPSPTVPPKQLRLLHEAGDEINRLRRAGKPMSARATFSGRLNVIWRGDFPARLTFDSVENTVVEELPDAGKLPVIPICELFQNLAARKGKRIAVRAEIVTSEEGSWITGRCNGAFYTNGYRWPVALDYAAPAYYSSVTASISKVRPPSGPPKNSELYKGRRSYVPMATYVGRLRMRSQYIAVCRGAGGGYLTNGYGHLNAAAAELVVEEIRDVEMMPQRSIDASEAEETQCEPPNHDALCAKASTLSSAVSQNCIDRVRELLAKNGIDVTGGESLTLMSAIGAGNTPIVKLLLSAGAPVNPPKTQRGTPLLVAASAGKLEILKLLLQYGANVNAKDRYGRTSLAAYGIFDIRVMKLLLEAGANPNDRDDEGQTPLMKASHYGSEETSGPADPLRS
jgi:hypothetical protein